MNIDKKENKDDYLIYNFSDEKSYIKIQKAGTIENAVEFCTPLNFTTDIRDIVNIPMSKLIFDTIFNDGIMRLIDSNMESSYTWRLFYGKNRYQEIETLIPRYVLASGLGKTKFNQFENYKKDILLMVEIKLDLKFSDDGHPYIKIKYGFDLVKIENGKDTVKCNPVYLEEKFQPEIINLDTKEIFHLMNWIQMNR